MASYSAHAGMMPVPDSFMPQENASHLVIRTLEAQARFAVAVCNLGLRSSLQLFGWHRLFKPVGIFELFIKKLNRRFRYRGNIDWGVMTHFYKPGYVINDTASDQKVGIIIDAGANIGTETLRFRHFHPGARIIAIEAEKQNFSLLSDNIRPDRNIFPIHAGLYSKTCRLKIEKRGASNESFSVSEVAADAAEYDVIGLSVPEIMREHRLDHIDILKLDIEGAERWVFDATADAWIGKVKVLIFECPDNDAPGTTAQIYDVLARNGLRFDTHLHGENLVLIRHDVDWKLQSDLLLRSHAAALSVEPPPTKTG
jgi:FkbM family methyltransferase